MREEEVMPGQSLVTFSFRNVMETIPSLVERLCRLRKEFRTDFKRKSETEKKEGLRGNRYARRVFLFWYCCCCCRNGEDLISFIILREGDCDQKEQFARQRRNRSQSQSESDLRRKESEEWTSGGKVGLRTG